MISDSVAVSPSVNLSSPISNFPVGQQLFIRTPEIRPFRSVRTILFRPRPPHPTVRPSKLFGTFASRRILQNPFFYSSPEIDANANKSSYRIRIASSWGRCSAARKWPCASCFCRAKPRTPACPNSANSAWSSSET